MTKNIAIFLFTFGTVGFTNVDTGPSTVQAICEVTLMNGEKIEGIISLGQYNDRSNGFCFENKKTGDKRIINYTLYFHLEAQSLVPARETMNLYYARNISTPVWPNEKTKFDIDKRVLTKTSTSIRKFELLDSMIMYKTLPTSLYVGYNKKSEGEMLFIDVDEISSIILVRKPSVKWLIIIDSARKKLREIQKVQDWEDYEEPIWFHDVMADEEKVKNLNRSLNVK